MSHTPKQVRRLLLKHIKKEHGNVKTSFANKIGVTPQYLNMYLKKDNPRNPSDAMAKEVGLKKVTEIRYEEI